MSKTLGERVSVIETHVENGSPALHEVDHKIDNLTRRVDEHDAVHVLHQEQIVLLREEVKQVATSHAVMINTLHRILIVLVGFVAGITLEAVLAEEGLKGIKSLLSSLFSIVF